MTALEDLIFKRQAELGGLKSKEEEYLGQALDRPDTSRDDQIGAALMALAPILVGAIAKGKKGANIGAQAALVGEESLGKRMAEDRTLAQKKALLGYQAVNDAKEKAEGDVSRAEFKQAEMSTKSSMGLGPKGTSIVNNINNPNLPVGLLTEIAKAPSVIGQLEGFRATVESKIPDWQKESWSTVEGVKAIGQRKLDEYVFGGDRAAGQAKRQLEGIIQYYQANNIKGVASDRDVERIERWVKGEALLPQTLPALMESIAAIQSDVEDFATQQAGFVRDLVNSPGREEEITRSQIDKVKSTARGKREAPFQYINSEDEGASGLSPEEQAFKAAHFERALAQKRKLAGLE